MGVRLAVLAFLLLTIVSAGCASKGAEPADAEETPSNVTVLEGADADAGEISGVVIDDSTLPIPDVTVAIRPLTVELRTDEAGAFTFSGVPPGEYTLVAAKLGYSSIARKVVLEPNAVVRQTLSLEAIQVEEDRYEVFGPYTGYLVCGFVRPGVQGAVGTVTYDCANTFAAASQYLGDWKNQFDFKMTQSNLAAVVGETQWTPSAAATSSKLQTFFTHSARSASHWWCSSMGATPTRFVYTLDADSPGRICHDKGSSTAQPEPTKDLTLRMQVYLPFCRVSTTAPTDVPVCVTYQQRYNAMATIFYGDEPSSEYSAFPDA